MWPTSRAKCIPDPQQQQQQQQPSLSSSIISMIEYRNTGVNKKFQYPIFEGLTSKNDLTYKKKVHLFDSQQNDKE